MENRDNVLNFVGGQTASALFHIIQGAPFGPHITRKLKSILPIMHKSRQLLACMALALALPAPAKTLMEVYGPESQTLIEEVNIDEVAALTMSSDDGLGLLGLRSAPIKTFSFADVSMLVFKTKDGGAETIAADGARVRLLQNPVAERLLFAGTPAEPSAATVTSLAGQTVAHFDGWNGEPLDVAQLAPGIYIFNFNRQSIKFIKK